MNAEQLVSQYFPDAKRHGKEWLARCTGHDDHNPSLAIGTGDDGRTLLRCHSQNCSVEAILKPHGLRPADLFNGNGHHAHPMPASVTSKSSTPLARSKPPPVKPFGTIDEYAATVKGKHVGTWMYQDPNGEDCFAALRFGLGDGKKSFRPMHAVDGGWLAGDPEGKLPLYGLATLADATRVYVVEGEACADALRTLGLVVTTSAHGALSADKTDWSPLAGKQVVTIPDSDQPGLKYVADVKRLCFELNPPASVITLPPFEGVAGYDIRDWLDSHDSVEPDILREQIESLVKSHKPENPPGVGHTLVEVLADLYAKVSECQPIIETITSGWGLLDELIGGLVRGGFVGVVGIPGCGKTTLCDRAVIDALRLNPKDTGIVFSLETDCSVRAARLVAGNAVRIDQTGGVSSCLPVIALLRGELRNAGREHALAAIQQFEAEIGNRLRFIDEVTAANEIAACIETHRPDVVLIDHLGLVTSPAGDADSEVSRFDAGLNRIVAALRATNAAAIIINEVGKQALRADNIDMAASRGSARFASLASGFVGLKRIPPIPPNKDPEIIALLAKNRFGPSDKIQRGRFFGGLGYFAWGPVTDNEQEGQVDG